MVLISPGFGNWIVSLRFVASLQEACWEESTRLLAALANAIRDKKAA
jgi:hypothetical protein